MAVSIPGVIAVVVFYLAILFIGIFFGRRYTNSKTTESLMVADRNLGWVISLLTITATMVGGGFLNGTSESVARYGFLHSQAPIGYSIGFLLAGVLFAPKMRSEGYITMFDPFQLKYGRKAGALLFIPQFFGDLFWSAAVLAALGATIAIILDINSTLAIIISAAVAIIYTVCGGLYAVAYTDVIQLIFIAVGLYLAFPFCLTHPAVDLSKITSSWAGQIPTNTIGSYIDVWLLCIGGGIPWQALYQRILACKTPEIAKWSAFGSCFLSMVLLLPAVVMGVAGAATDWQKTDYNRTLSLPNEMYSYLNSSIRQKTAYNGTLSLPDEMYSYILPLTLNFLTPLPIGIIGIGAIAAAVMSSADSCILSSGSIFTKNVYNDIFRPNASQREIFWVLRITIVVLGIMGTMVAIFSNTIYGLFILCGDLMYVILFPQLCLVMWLRWSNAYGSVAGFFASLILRLLCGEPVINLPAIIKFPLYDESTGIQNFPIRTFVMLVGVAFLVVVSFITKEMFVHERVPRRYDLLKCYQQKSVAQRVLKNGAKADLYPDEVESLTEFKKNDCNFGHTEEM